MVHLGVEHIDSHFGYISLTLGLFVSISAVVALCAKQSLRRSNKEDEERRDSNFVMRTPMVKPSKQLVRGISDKAIQCIHLTSNAEAGNGAMEEAGDGVWRKAILMGEKCQPPEFSGAIFYDHNGNRLSELPLRSPRASPLPSFMLPPAKDAN